MIFSTSCGTITFRNNFGVIEILLIRQSSNSNVWSLPKGHIEENETQEQCAVRETKEETGIAPTILFKVGEITLNLKKENKRVIIFSATDLNNQEISIEDPDCEISEARWFDIDKLPKIQSYQRKWITVAIDHYTIWCALAEISTFADAETEWISIKKIVLHDLNSRLRKYFSTRDPITKKQKMNSFEMNLIIAWKNLTGVLLNFPPN